MKHSLPTLIAITLIALLSDSPAFASSETWQGGTGNWNSTNWGPSGGPSGSAAPGAVGTTGNGDTATFNTGSGTVTVDANRNIDVLTFTGTAGAYTLSGGPLVISAGGTIQLGTSATSFTGSNITETINASIEYATQYSNININNNSSNATDALVVNGSIAGQGDTGDSINLGGVNTGANTISGIIQNGGRTTTALYKQGAGTWILSGANTFSGGTSFASSSGTLQLNNSLALQDSVVNTTNGNLVFNAGLGSATFQGLSGSTNLALQDNAGSPAAVTLDLGTYFNVNTDNYTGILSGSGGVTKFGFNTQTFSQSNIYTGTTTVDLGGTLAGVGASATATTPFSTGAIMLNAGTLSVAPATAATAANWTGASGITSGSALTYGSGSTLALTKKDGSSSITFTVGGGGTAALTRSGNGTLIIKTANAGDLGTGAASSENLVINGTAPTVTNGMVNASIVGMGTTASQEGDFLTYGANGFQLATYTHESANFNPSSPSLSTSVVNVTASSSTTATGTVYALQVGQGGNVALTIGSGDTLNVGDNTAGHQAGIILNDWLYGNSSIVGANATTSILNFGADEGIIYGFGNGDVGNINALVAGSGGLTISGTEPIGLTNQHNTFAGGLAVDAGGVLSYNSGPGSTEFSNGFFGDPNNVITFNGGATTNATAGAPGSALSAGIFGVGRSIVLGSQGATFEASNNYVAPISGSGPLYIGGAWGTNFAPGNQYAALSMLSGKNTFSGGIYLMGEAEAVVSSSNNLGASTDPIVFDGGILGVMGNSLNNLGSHPLTFSPTTGTYGGDTAGFDIESSTNTLTISQNITMPSGTFYKFGPGTLDLTGVNNWVGSTQLLGGVLQLDESSGGSLQATTYGGVYSPLNFGGGTLTVLGSSSGATTQNFGAVTFTSLQFNQYSGSHVSAQYSGGSLIANNNGGNLTVNLGALTGMGSSTATGTTVNNIGTSFDIVAQGSGTSTITTTTQADSTGTGGAGTGIYGGRVVYTAGGTTNWAGSSLNGAGTYTISAYNGYSNFTSFVPGATISQAAAANLQLTGTDSTSLPLFWFNQYNNSNTTLTFNSLAIAPTGSGQYLDIQGFDMTLNSGGLLFTGSNNYTILDSYGGGALESSLLSGSAAYEVMANGQIPVGPGDTIASAGSDLIIQQYGTGRLTISAVIANTNIGAMSSLTKAGPGTLVLAAANTYTGYTTINGGTLNISSDANIGGANGLVTVTSTSGSTYSLASLPAGFGVGSIISGQYVTNITGSGLYTVSLSGTPTTATNQTVAWATAENLILNGGTLQVSGNTTLAETHAAGAVGGTATMNRYILFGSTGAEFDAINGATLNMSAATMVESGGGQAQPTTITIDSSDNSNGTVILPGSSVMAANWNLNGGILRLSGSTSLGLNGGVFGALTFGPNEALSTATGHLQLNGNSAVVAGLYDSTLTSAVIEDGNGSNTNVLFGVINGDNETYAGSLVNTTGTGTGTLGFFKAGGGTMNLTNTGNSYTGKTEIDGGILNVASLANGGSNSSIGASSNAASNLLFGGSIVSGDGTLQYNGSTAQSTDHLFTLGDNGNVVSGSSVDVGGNDGTIDASGSLTAATLTFSNTGAIAFGNTGVHSLTLTGTNTGANTFAPLLGDSTYNSTVFSTSLIKSNTGTWDVTNAGNTYSGTTTIDGGILNVAALANINTASSIGQGSSGGSAADLVFNGGTLQYSGSSATSTNRLFTIGDSTGSGNSATIDASGTTSGATVSFTGSGPIAFANTAAHNLTLTGSNTGANTFAPVLGDSSASPNNTSLTKTGAGTWVLTGANTYTGATTINGGVLQVNGSLASGSTVTVGGASASGSPELSGTGIVNGNVIVSSVGGGAAGALNPGADTLTSHTVGTLTVGSVTFQTGSLFSLDLSGATTDLLTIGGAATINSGADIKFTVGSTLTLGNYVLATATSGLNGNAFTLSGSLPTGYVLVATATSLDLTHLATIGSIVPTLGASTPAGSIITGGSLPFAYTVSNSAPLGSNSLVASGTAATNTTGSAGPVTVAAQATSGAQAGISFNGTTVGPSQAGTFTITDSNSTNSPQTGTVSVNVYGHADPSLGGTTLNLGFVHQGYASSVTSSNNLTATNSTAGVNGSYIVNLQGSGAGGGVTLTSITGSGVAPGGTTSIAASLATGHGLGSFSPVTYTFADDSTLSGASANVGTSSITFTGEVYSGQSIWAGTGSSGNWGTLASGFATNWGTNQGSPGLDSGFTGVDTATFNNVAGQANVAVNLNGANPNLNSITFNSPATSYNLSASGGGTITLSGSTPGINVAASGGTQTISAPVALASSATYSAGTGATLTDSGTITAAGGITLTTSGAVYLTGNNSLTGLVTVTSGRLSIPTLATVGSAQPLGENSTVALAGGTSSDGILQYTGGTTTMGQNITVTPGDYGTIDNSGGGTLTLGGTLTKTGIASGAATVLTLSGGTFIVTGQITGTDASFNSDFAVDGATVTLDNSNNNYSGPTYVYGGGTLINGITPNALPVSTTVTLGANSGGTDNSSNTYDLNGSTQTIAGLNNSGSGTQQVINSNGSGGANATNGALTLAVTSGTDTFGGSLGGAGSATNFSVTKSGAGTVVLTANNRYSQGTTISGGTLQVGNGGTSGTLGAGTVTDDATLSFDRINAITESNTITGNGTVNQIGSGAVTFTANNSYTGGTTISNGTLYANNATGSTGSGTVTVSSGGTIAGLGTVALSGTHLINLTGTGAIVPGGVQSGTVANGNLTIDTTNITAHSTILSLNGSSANPANNASLTFTLGSGNHMNANQEIDTGSQLVVTGPGGMAVANTIAFDVGGGSSNLVNINDLVGDGLVRNGEYVLIDGSNTTYTGLMTNLYPTIMDGYNFGYQITGGLAIGSGAYDSSLLFLKGDNIDMEVAPEPSTWALFLGSLALLVFYQRRQRKAGVTSQ